MRITGYSETSSTFSINVEIHNDTIIGITTSGERRSLVEFVEITLIIIRKTLEMKKKNKQATVYFILLII